MQMFPAFPISVCKYFYTGKILSNLTFDHGWLFTFPHVQGIFTEILNFLGGGKVMVPGIFNHYNLPQPC